VRLRRADCAVPGYRRVRAGRGFRYLDPCGRPIRDPEERQRIAQLAIPPAWTDVWICPDPAGHIQATGRDAAGRLQYRYHDAWRARRDAEKFERMLDFAQALPRLRREVERDLGRPGLPRERVLACAVRLLDLGFFRVGGEEYAEAHGSYGLATLRKEHVQVHGQWVVFEYPAKSGQHRIQAVVDPAVAEIVSRLRRRRTGGDGLLAWNERGRWTDVRSADVNVYLKQHAGEQFSAKDFRTWNATLLAAAAFAAAVRAPATPAARKRVVAHAYREVAHYLGNTPAVCRTSYVDPRVVDCYLAGETVQRQLESFPDLVAGLAPLTQLEDSVVRLLRRSPAKAA
jgi:DNA topoisomerase-1